MISEEEKEKILRSISLTGAVLEENQQSHFVLGSRSNLNHIAGVSSGPLKIYPSVAKKFNLILSQPSELSTLNAFEVRCVLCKQVISYPAWYYRIAYAVNVFHYFVCFDKASPNSVNVHCYRRS